MLNLGFMVKMSSGDSVLRIKAVEEFFNHKIAAKCNLSVSKLYIVLVPKLLIPWSWRQC